MDVFYISYDEPHKEAFWQSLREHCPQAQRVDGVKGFDKAHKVCAERSQTGRFFTIDGDNQLLEAFFQVQIPESLLNTDYVLSWSAKNNVNGLAYGNGGVKNWRKDVVLNMRSHEDSQEESSAVDFCFTLKYYQMPELLSTSVVNQTPFQAFRAGFREGVKMSLDKGYKLTSKPGPALRQELSQKLHASNLERLKIWCSVGSDVVNGLWAIYGARLGCAEFYLRNTPLENIRDYDWFQSYWDDKVLKSGQLPSEAEVLQAIHNLKEPLSENVGLDLALFDPAQSRFFKSVYFNRPRQGLMFP